MNFYNRLSTIFKKVETKSFDIPVFLSSRKISESDSPVLIELFKRNNIEMFGELSADMLKEFLRYSYPSAISAIQFLGLYGAEFYSERLQKYSAGSDKGLKLIKYPKNNEQLPLYVDNTYEHEALLLNRYLFDNGITTNFLINGMNINVLEKACNIPQNILEGILKPEYYSDITNIYNNMTNSPELVHETENCAPLISLVSLFDKELLSVRSYNALISAGYKYLNELEDVKILSVPNIGPQSFAEIIALINLMNNGELTEIINQDDVTNLSDDSLSIQSQQKYEYLDLSIMRNELLSLRSQNALVNAGYKSIDEVAKLNLIELRRIVGLGKKSIKEIQSVCALLFSKNETSGTAYTKQTVQKIPSQIAKTDLRKFELSARLSNVIINQDFHVVEDLLAYGINAFSKLPNVGTNTVKELEDLFLNLNIDIHKPYEIVETEVTPVSLQEKINNLVSSIQSFEDILKKDEKKWDVYLGRLQIQKKKTLQELATKYSLTRERVRQIEINQEKKLIKIFETNDVINDICHIYGEIFSLNVPELNPLLNYINIISNIADIDDENGYRLDTELGIIYKNKIDLNDITDVTSLPRTISKDDIKEIVSNRLTEYVNVNEENPNTNDNFHYLLNTFISTITKNNYEYNNEIGQYTLIEQSKISERIAEMFKVLYPQGVLLRKHIDEVFLRMQKELPDIDLCGPRALEARLSGNQKLILVDIGKYCHIDTIHYSVEAVDYALQLCKIKIAKEKHPFIIDTIYEQEKTYFNANGIFSNYLLFSLLKRKKDPSLSFKRLTVSSSNWDKLTQIDIFESFFLEQKGIIPNNIVEEHFHSIGWDDLRISTYLGFSNNIFRTTSGYFHKANIQINREKLEKIIKKIETKVEEYGFLSLETIRKNNFADWLDVYNQDDLDTKSMVSVIKAFYPDFKYGITPSGIISQNRSSKPKDVLYDWLNNLCHRRQWVTTAEINNFCEVNNLRSYNVKAQIRNQIQEISEECWVTNEYAGIEESTSKYILELINKVFLSTNKIYLNFEDIITKYDLPELKNGCQWSPYLLQSILLNAGATNVINFVIINPFQTKIKTKDQLIAYVLADFAHTWYMPIEKLERLLRRNNILKRNETLKHRSVQNDLFNDNTCLELRDQNKNVCIKPEYKGCYCENL